MKTIVYINFILTITLVGAVVWLFVYQKPSELVTQIPSQYVDQCGESCKKQITENVATALSTVSAIPKETVKTVIITPAPLKTKLQTAYIPINGPITTTSTTWYDAPRNRILFRF